MGGGERESGKGEADGEREGERQRELQYNTGLYNQLGQSAITLSNSRKNLSQHSLSKL